MIFWGGTPKDTEGYTWLCNQNSLLALATIWDAADQICVCPRTAACKANALHYAITPAQEIILKEFLEKIILYLKGNFTRHFMDILISEDEGTWFRAYS